MAIALPRRTVLTSIVAVVGLAVLGAGLLAGGAVHALDGADLRLHCPARSTVCSYERTTIAESRTETIRALNLGEVATTHATRSAWRLAFTPNVGDPARTLPLGEFDRAEADRHAAALEQLRDAGGRPDELTIEWNGRAPALGAAAIWVAIGLGALAAARSQARAHARPRSVGAEQRSPGPPTGEARRQAETRHAVAVVQQRQLAPVLEVVAPLLAEPVVAAGSFKPSGATRRAWRWPGWVVAVRTETSLYLVGVAYVASGTWRPAVAYRALGVLAAWPLTTIEVRATGTGITTRALLVQAPGVPLVELVDAAGRGGLLVANDLLYESLDSQVAHKELTSGRETGWV